MGTAEPPDTVCSPSPLAGAPYLAQDQVWGTGEQQQ